MTNPVSGQIIKTARTLLNWGQRELAERAGCSLTTLVALERANTSHHETTRARIIQALERGGVEFIPREQGKGMGVRYSSIESELAASRKSQA